MKITPVPEAHIVGEPTDGYVTLQITTRPFYTKKSVIVLIEYGSVLRIHRQGFWWWFTADNNEILRGRSIWRSIDIVSDSEDYSIMLARGQSLYSGDPALTVHMGGE